MPRQAQLGFPGTLYHVIAQGNVDRISWIRVQMAIELKGGGDLALAEEVGQPGVFTWATSRICMINSVKIN